MRKFILALSAPEGAQLNASRLWAQTRLSPLLLNALPLPRLHLDYRLPPEEQPQAPAEGLPSAPGLLLSLWTTQTSPCRARILQALEEAEKELPGPCPERQLWEVEEHSPKSYRRDWPVGEPSPGVKMISLMRPVAPKSGAECARWWRQKHTPLALRIHVGLWNYRQNVVTDTLFGNIPEVYGIGELHFRNTADYREKFFSSPAGQEAIMEDVAHFLSLEHSAVVHTRELILRDTP